jgi:hypothetical protein
MMNAEQLKGKWVESFYNLHKHVLSVRRKGKVVAHVPSVMLENAKFAVQPAGREKVLREKRKNVHAFVRGHYEPIKSEDVMDLSESVYNWQRVYYNPYKTKTFEIMETGEPIHEAIRVIIKNKEIWALQ